MMPVSDSRISSSALPVCLKTYRENMVMSVGRARLRHQAISSSWSPGFDRRDPPRRLRRRRFGYLSPMRTVAEIRPLPSTLGVSARIPWRALPWHISHRPKAPPPGTAGASRGVRQGARSDRN